MKAIITVGHGDYAMLQYREVAIPVPGPGEVLLQVLAAGVNNTDINTRVGWYGKTDPSVLRKDAAMESSVPGAPLGWSGATPFPLIQGADCCGRVVACGPGPQGPAPGTRVLVRSCMRHRGFGAMDTRWLGTDFDGAFAQFVKVPAGEVFPVDCNWSDTELASIPCAYGSAENMLHRAGVGPGEHVLVSGASGGVGSAVVQLAKRRGAIVTALTSMSKRAQVLRLGADRVICRDEHGDAGAPVADLQVDVVVDNVGGPAFPAMLGALRRGGRYVSSGAIGGPLVTLDLRTLYLRDLRMIGCTAWDEPVFPLLIGYIERGEIRPLVAQTFALSQIADAQRAFLEKRHVGNIVLVPELPAQLPSVTA